MINDGYNSITCSQFEELLIEYLDKSLDSPTNKAVAEHALKCPLCHALLNEVKDSLEICHELSAPNPPITLLEARIIERTTPQTAMACEEFEDFLTDYLDGFLPAQIFHRWERHAVLCGHCTDLPGAVVRSIATCYTYKMEELALPAGLHVKILQATIGTAIAAEIKASRASQFGEWIRGLRLPIPQLAPVAMMLLFAFLVFSQTVSADGSLTDIYQKSYALAEQTYKQGADALGGKTPQQNQNQEPVDDTIFVEDKK